MSDTRDPIEKAATDLVLDYVGFPSLSHHERMCGMMRKHIVIPTKAEWQAIYDALAFTARGSGCVSDAHNRAVDHACKILGLPLEPNPE